MAYIYKKNVNGKTYFYLRISKRIKGKLMVKDVAYLGNKISDIETKLNKLTKYKQEIRKGYRNINKFIQKNHYLGKIQETHFFLKN